MKWLFIVVFLCLTIGTVSSAEFTDTFQHQTAITDNWQKFNGAESISYVTSGPTYNKEMHMQNGLYGSGSRGARMKYPSESSYWSFFLHKTRTGYNVGSVTVHFWDSSNTSTVSFTVYGPFQSDTAWITTNRHLEFQYESGAIYWRINGVDQGYGCACSFTPAYIGIGGHKGLTGSIKFYVDNVHNKEGIVGICDESNNVEHTITELTNDVLSNTWGINTIPIAEYNTSQFDMEVKRATWAEIYNTTRIKDGGNTTILPYGSFAYNWSDTFRTDHYGLYWFNLYKTLSGEPELIGQDFIYFKDVGEPSTINIEDTEYAIGETMNISYYIDSPDFGANQYKIQIFDVTGQLKDERVLMQQAATEQITSTIDWEEGMLYAVLVKDTKPAIDEDPPEDIIDLAYDFCTMSNVIYVTGKVYDASNADMLVDGTLLDNVSLNWTQAGTIYSTTSDANGEYVFLDPGTLLEVEWFQDVPITVHAEKTGYTHSDFDMIIIKAGRYTVNIYMTPPYDYENISISGVVADDIFHQSLPYAEVHIWNATWSDAMYTNTWGWYEFNNLTNDTYNMYAKKETYRDSSVIQVHSWNMSLTLDSCDSMDYVESTLDECDSTTGWNSANTLTLNTTDYIESTGSLQSVGANTMDFNKTFSPAFDSNISKARGRFYFYSKIDNTTNISSVNVTVTLSSNATGATDTLVWEINKTLFSNVWNLTFLELAQATETGTCDLSAIRFFELESTKSASVTTKIDFLAFIEYLDWNSNINLSADTSDKQEGAASILIEGKAWTDGSYDHYFGWSPGGIIPPPPNVSVPEYWVDRYWSAPPSGASAFSANNELGRLQIWYKPQHTKDTDMILASGDTSNYLYWQDVGSSGWTLETLFFKDAYENGTMDFGSIKWFILLGNRTGAADVEDRIDHIELVQTGGTRQNFFLSQNYNLTVYAKDMDTRYTITSFTAILDSTTVAETTTGAILFPNVTYGIYPLEVSANGYYTNKQYVFMGQDTTQTVYLTKVENVSGGGAGTYYAPHRVEFKVQNLFGYPVEDVTVSTNALATTAMNWDWLWKALGLRDDVALEMENGTMNGTTDSHGGISFLMEPTIKYSITFTKAGTNINESMTIYPKDDTYLVIVTTLTEERNRNEYVSWNFSAVDESPPTHANLTFNYTDALDKTTTLYFFVKDENRTEIFNQTFSSQGIIDVGYIVNRSKGQSYIWGFNCTHEEFGFFAQSKFITFKSRLIDLGTILPDDDKYYTWISIALLVFIAGLFSVTVSKFGYVLIPGFGLFFSYIGWLSTNITLLTVAMGLGILAFMGKMERDKGL